MAAQIIRSAPIKPMSVPCHCVGFQIICFRSFVQDLVFGVYFYLYVIFLLILEKEPNFCEDNQKMEKIIFKVKIKSETFELQSPPLIVESIPVALEGLTGRNLASDYCSDLEISGEHISVATRYF